MIAPAETRHSGDMEGGQGEGGGPTVVAVAGGIVALLAAGLLVAGSALLWLAEQRDSTGYLTTGPHDFTSPTFAISSDDLDVVADAPRWLFDQDRLGTIRIRAIGSEHPLFIGVARTQDVNGYLLEVPHQVVTDVGTDPFDVAYREAIGSRPPRPPEREPFWVAASVIPSNGELSWDVAPGRWAVVVMNADGSAGIDARLELGAKVGFLVPVGVGLIVGGALLFIVGVGGIVFGLLARPVEVPPSRPAKGVVGPPVGSTGGGSVSEV
jgi:hypothetical protein